MNTSSPRKKHCTSHTTAEHDALCGMLQEQESQSRALAAMRETEAANCQLQQMRMLALEEDRRADAAIAGCPRHMTVDMEAVLRQQRLASEATMLVCFQTDKFTGA